MINNISFLGVAKPYINSQGCKIIPIHKNPTEKEVQEAIETTNKKNDSRGRQGEVWTLGEDLVIKRYYKSGGATSNKKALERETSQLDMFYENGVDLGSSQKGMYGIISPDDECYLVSSKVVGSLSNPVDNPFTKENLSKLIDYFLEMDKGYVIKEGKKRHRLMHYDLTNSNIHVTSNSAGLLDFEWSRFEDLDNGLEKEARGENTGWNYHRSHTSRLVSNLSSFEPRAFYRFLKEIDNPREMFEGYLGLKSKYHKGMAEFYKDYLKQDVNYKKEISEIGLREHCHGVVLGEEKLSSDVVKAEAIKIEMARNIANLALTTGKINLEQLRKLISSANEFFAQKVQEAKQENNFALEIYYKDCAILIKEWGESFEEAIYYTYQNNRDKYNKIFTDEPQNRLFEMMGFSLN